jgi:hypothetical protein
MLDRTTKSVLSQLEAMRTLTFDIGVRSELTEAMINKKNMTLKQVLKSIGWLKYMNCRQNHIYVKPAKEHSLCLLDDLNKETLTRMKKSGYAPAVIVETSNRNYQAWLYHGQILEKPFATQVATHLARLFNADLSSADASHYGRLVGFTNPKEKYRQCNGHFPFTKLIEFTGVVYQQAQAVLKLLKTSANKSNQRILSQPSHLIQKHNSKNNIPLRPMKTIDDFQSNPSYQGDFHRADMAWAIYAARYGIPNDDVVHTLLNSRNLDHKGNKPRQLAYALRTAKKAFR